MKKKKNNTNKKYYVVLTRTPLLTPEVGKGKRNKIKIMTTSVIGIYKSVKTANKWAKICKNEVISIFDKAYKFNGWKKIINEDGTENYLVRFKKSKELFEVNVFKSKVLGAPSKQYDLYFDDELEDEETIKNVEKYLQEQAEEIKGFEEE